MGGVPITDLPLYTLRGAIGFVSQEPFLFDGSISDNILYGRPHATPTEVIDASVAAGAWEFIDKLPDGLNTLVGERGVRLSGGQRQRLSLARAIVKDPPMLILDEATSAVDNETEAAIQKSLALVSRGRTVLVIAHRLSTIVQADNIVVLQDGQIAESGTHAELLQSGGLYSSQWLVQTGLVQTGRVQTGQLPGE